MARRTFYRRFSVLTLFALAMGCAPDRGPKDGPATAAADVPRVSAATTAQLAVVGAANAASQAAASVPVDITPALGPARVAAQAALDKATERVGGWQPPLPVQPHWRALLSGDRTAAGSLSMGTVGRGELFAPAQLPDDGPHHEIIARHRRRNTNFATDELVRLLQVAAERVDARYPGAPLRVGNMSRRRGGDIPWSGSHNSGRDADLAFYVVRADDGVSVPAPDLLSCEGDRTCPKHPELRFDVARNWALVEALLSQDIAGIQWIFVSLALKDQLLAFARKNGADAEVIARAEEVLHQPTDAPPHDDHFHLRITCPKDDRLEGCLDFGPRWSWVDWHRDDLLARSLALADALAEGEPAERMDALAVLETIRSPYAPEVALRHALVERDVTVRLRALEVASSIPTWSGAAIRLAQRFIESPAMSLDEKAVAYSILRRSIDPLVPAFLRTRVADEALPVGERVIAARAMAHTMEPELVPFLLEQLGRQPAAVRAEIAMVLRRIANRAEGLDWRHAADPVRQQALEAWSRWWEEHREMERDQWLLAGFSRRGYAKERLLSMNVVDDIIPLLAGEPDHIAYNANWTLRRVTGRWTPLEAWDYDRLHRWWAGWWGKNRERMLASGE